MIKLKTSLGVNYRYLFVFEQNMNLEIDSIMSVPFIHAQCVIVV